MLRGLGLDLDQVKCRHVLSLRTAYEQQSLITIVPICHIISTTLRKAIKHIPIFCFKQGWKYITSLKLQANVSGHDYRKIKLHILSYSDNS